jgi:hypothetical protein
MGEDLTAALFTGRELRGCGPGRFVHATLLGPRGAHAERELIHA